MAYDIPVAALVLDHALAASALGLPPDFFDNDQNDRSTEVEKLAQLTGADVGYFASEDMSVYHVGIFIKDDWCIDIDVPLMDAAIALKKQYPHPLIQTARLAVVSQFC